MSFRCHELHGTRVLECEAVGPEIRSERDATDLIGAASGEGAALVAIPVSRLSNDFFRLKTGTAGAMLQKFVTYHVRVAIVGDVSAHVSESDALRDFVYECNRGEHIWFVTDMDDLASRLAPAR